MLRTVEGFIDQNGTLKLLETVALPRSRRVLVTILDEELLDEEPSDEQVNLALLSEEALAKEWSQAEEDEAWSHLSQLPSL